MDTVEISCYVTAAMVHFRYYRENEVVLAWSRPCTDRSQTEPTSLSCAATLFLPDFIQIGAHLGDWKPNNLYSSRNRGRPLSERMTTNNECA